MAGDIDVIYTAGYGVPVYLGGPMWYADQVGLFRVFMVMGGVGTVLTAGYFLWMLQRVNLGEPNAEWEGHEFHDVDRFELTAWVPLIVLIVVIGFYPKIIFDTTTDAVTSLVEMAFGTETTAAASTLVKGG